MNTKLTILLLNCLLTFTVNAQTTLTTAGSSIFNTGSEIYIKGNLVNNGSKSFPRSIFNEKKIFISGDITNNQSLPIFSDAGEVVLNGANNQYINGDSLRFYKLTIDKSADTLILNQHITVVDSLKLLNQNIYLNGFNIDLYKTGLLVGEDSTSRIFGDSGLVKAYRFLNTSAINNDIAGLGLFIESTENFDWVQINRGHKQLNVGNGSILRYFNIQTTNTGYADSIKIKYIDQYDLDTLQEADLSLWVLNNYPWKNEGGLVDTLNDFVITDSVKLSNTLISLTEYYCDILPLVDLGADTLNLCIGDTLLLDAGISNLWYEWSNADTTQTTKVFIQNNYWVAVTAANGCIGFDTTFVIERALPLADFMADSSCHLQSTSFNNLSSISSGMLSYFWDFGDLLVSSDTSNFGNPIFVYDSSGIFNVRLQATSEYGCVHDTIKQLLVNALPKVAFDFDYGCNDLDAIFHNNTIIKDSSMLNFSWDLGDMSTSNLDSLTHTYADTGTYIVKLLAISEFACEDSFANSIKIYPLPQIDFGGTITTCVDSITLFANNPGATYLWSDASTADSFFVNVDGTYWLSITGQNNCVASDTVDVFLSVEVKPNLGNDATYCESYLLDAGNPGSQYLWSTGDTTRYLNVINTDFITLMLTDPNNCVGYDTINLIINPNPNIDLGNDTVLCNGASMPLNAGSGFVSYVWSNTELTQNIIVSDSGLYKVVITDINNCKGKDSIQIGTSNFTVDLGADIQYICDNGALTVDADLASFYDWQNSTGSFSNQQVVSLSKPDTYWFKSINDLGCVAYDTFEIQLSKDLINAHFLAISQVQVGDTIQFVDLSYPNPITFNWDFDDGAFASDSSPMHHFDSAGVYNVQLVVSNNICIDTLIKSITVGQFKKEPVLQIDNQQELFVDLLKLSAYPNPTSDVINISVELTNEDYFTLYVFDLSGREISAKRILAEKHLEQIDLSNSDAGNYLIGVVVNNKSRYLKILKVN